MKIHGGIWLVQKSFEDFSLCITRVDIFKKLFAVFYCTSEIQFCLYYIEIKNDKMQKEGNYPVLVKDKTF